MHPSAPVTSTSIEPEEPLTEKLAEAPEAASMMVIWAPFQPSP